MIKKILGLDIGSHSIKAALFETTFRSYELTDLFQSSPLRLEEADPQEHDVIISEAILQILQKNNLHISTTVTALSGKSVSNRMIKLPLPPKQIDKVLPFEIENYIPFPLDELILDHHVVKSEDNQTVCLVAAAQKTIVEHHLALLKRAHIEPSFVTFDTLALYNLNQFIPEQTFKTYAIIDVGYQKTSICIIANGQLAYSRTLYIAGRDIDEALRAELNLTLEQASEVKEKHGIIELDLQPLKSADLKKLSACIKGVINPLFQEIFQSFHMFRSQEWVEAENQKIEHVLFCGGTSLLRNLPEYFTSLIQIPSRRLYLLEAGDPERSSRMKEPVFATAVAIGMKISARGKKAKLIETINFLKGAFSSTKAVGDVKDKLIFFGKWAAVIFGLAFLQLIIRNTALRTENKNIEKVALQEFKKVLPEEKAQSSKSALKKLEAKIQELEQKQDVLTAGLTQTTSLGVLRQISMLIPETVPVDTKELTIDRNKITLKGETDSFASVDKMVASLQGVTDFQRVEKGDMHETPEGKKSFQLTILVGDQNPKDGKEEKSTKEKK